MAFRHLSSSTDRENHAPGQERDTLFFCFRLRLLCRGPNVGSVSPPKGAAVADADADASFTVRCKLFIKPGVRCVGLSYGS